MSAVPNTKDQPTHQHLTPPLRDEKRNAFTCKGDASARRVFRWNAWALAQNLPTQKSTIAPSSLKTEPRPARPRIGKADAGTDN